MLNKNIDRSIIRGYIEKFQPRFRRTFSRYPREENLKPIYINLFQDIAEHKFLRVIPEYRLSNNRKPDAIIKNGHYTHGIYEGKSPNTILEQEIDKIKKSKKYPTENTIFENSNFCILYQKDRQIKRVDIKKWNDKESFSEILSLFFNYDPPKLKKYRKALMGFTEKIPYLEIEIKNILNKMNKNPQYKKEIDTLVVGGKSIINNSFKKEDVEHWLIQHILTKQIFLKVFDNQIYHSKNNISKVISNIDRVFFKEHKMTEILDKIRPYMEDITDYGSTIIETEDKQEFLKEFYQNFYKKLKQNKHNDKSSTTLGTVYTPRPIVKFIVKSTDNILKKHFNKKLTDKGVHILDPSTGTATFVTELMDYICNKKNEKRLKYKYKNEIHANEISVLPYYVANLSIEDTYKDLIGEHSPFENLVLTDTLKNYALLGGQQSFKSDVFKENQKKVDNQNKKKIQVILGNPPYYNKQIDQISYTKIEDRVRQTYKIHSKAKRERISQDMYIYFLRWATDRIGNNHGIISFVLNSSFLDGISGQGIRASLEKEFNNIYILDLGGNTQKDALAGSNVFNVRIGICIVFLVKSGTSEKAQIEYLNLSKKLNQTKGSLKLVELFHSVIDNIKGNTVLNNNYKGIDHKFEVIKPNNIYQWIKQETEFKGLCLNDLFSQSFPGIVTGRDKIVYDKSKRELEKRITTFIKELKEYISNSNTTDIELKKIKAKLTINKYLEKKIKNGSISKLFFDRDKVSLVGYRQDRDAFYYSEKVLSERLTKHHFRLWGKNLKKNEIALCWCVFANNRLEAALSDKPVSSDYFGTQTNALTRITCYQYLKEGAPDFFGKKYGIKLSREDIFYYIVGLFYSKKYKETIRDNYYNKDNLPILTYENKYIEQYIKDGKKRILELRKSGYDAFNL